MRLSSDKRDSGYDAWQRTQMFGKRVKIFLDDKEMNDVDIADDELGYVRQYKKDDKGHIFLDEKTAEIASQELSGKVRIEIK